MNSQFSSPSFIPDLYWWYKLLRETSKGYIPKSFDLGIQEILARNPKTPPVFLKAIAANPQNYIVREVAANPATPPQTLSLLFANFQFLDYLAKNPLLPQNLLMQLIEESFVVEDQELQLALAANPATPKEIVDKLLFSIVTKDSLFDIRAQAATNPLISEELLLYLLKFNDSVEIDTAIAQNPATPPDLLVMLADSAAIRPPRAVAANPNTPLDTLLLLASGERYDDDIMVANVASNPALPEKYLTDFFERKFSFFIPRAPWKENQMKEIQELITLGLARNPSLPPAFLKVLSLGDFKVKTAVGGNPSTAPDTLLYLSKDAALDVRAAVAANTSTPPEALAALSGPDQPWYIRYTVTKNPATPDWVLWPLTKEEEELTLRLVAVMNLSSLST